MYLYKKWYKDAKRAEQYHLAVMQDETTVTLPFEISPLRYDGHFQLYYRPTNNMLTSVEKVYQQDALLTRLDQALPGIAKENFLRRLVVDEIFDSNALENVQSTHAEIAASAKAHREKVAGKRRLSSMVNSYYGLSERVLHVPMNANDVRKIYNYITDGEIAVEDLPDGEVFRAGPVSVLSGVAGKSIHEGLMPESQIIDAIENLTQFMQESPLPAMIKIAVGHYYFGYIHPFYDGNGRTGRFMSSLYLSKICSEYTAYSLSQGCRLQQKKYGDIFKRTNDFRSFGEINCFIDGFLEIIIDGQAQIIEDLQERQALLEQAYRRIQDDPQLCKDETSLDLMFVFEQGHLFDDFDEGFTLEALQKYLETVSKAQLRRSLDALEAIGYIRRVKARPITYISAWE